MFKANNFIELIKQNDEKTIRALYNDNKNGFLLFANRYNLNHHDVLDVYQDAIVAFIENAKKGKIDDLKSSLSTYIFSIGKFMIFKILKKQNKHYLTDDFADLEYKEEDYSEDELDLQVVLLQKSFNKLGDQCKKVLQLFYYEEKKLDEIQQQLGYSSKDVLKSQKSRCLKQLKDFTKEN